MIDFGREACGRIGVSGNREWLVTNGIGGFAMGTIAGILTRRYHGLLFAALKPPLGRTLMLAKLDETVKYLDEYYPIHTNRWFGDSEESPGLEEPHGYHNIERFRLEGTTPVWTFACADAVLEKRIWMEQGENTTYIQYSLLRASSSLKLYPKAFINYRDYHKTTIAEDWDVEVDLVANGLRIVADDEAQPLYLFSEKGEIYPQEEWHEDFFLSLEEFRGQPDVVEDHLNIADFDIVLNPGESVTIVATTNSNPRLNGVEAYERQKAHERRLVEQVEALHGKLDWAMRQLVLAADQFVVKRATPVDSDGMSIIGGYPWFGDWGRETMVSLPGIALCNGRYQVSEKILRTYAQFVDQGMLPNRFPDEGEQPEYNTVDATLWYFQALRTHMEATDDKVFLRELYPILQEIIEWHQKGTRYNIKMDAADGLLYAGEEGYQLTWMDSKVEDWVITPRTGKPVEVNALWYNALCCMGHFANLLGEDGTAYTELAEQVRTNFIRFWYSPEGYCYDVVDGPEGHDATLRPNQLLAVSLSYSPLPPDKQKAIVDICTKRLVTSHGLRTLAQTDAQYIGQYVGDRKKRDEAYHQGTVWGWLIGPFIAAHLRVYKDPEMASSYLKPALRHLRDHGLGSISEIFDGDAPFAPRGCTADAGSVGEYLRSWCMIRKARQNGK